MQSDRITRALWHEATFGVTPWMALARATREFAVEEYFTPWELVDSQYAEDYLAWYIRQTESTVQ